MISIASLKVDEIISSEQFMYELSDEDKEELKESIENIGLIYPLVVIEVGNKYRILDGRSRFQVLKELKWESIPCIIVKTDPRVCPYEYWRIHYEVELFRRHLTHSERKRCMRLLKQGFECSEIVHTLFAPKIAEKIKKVVLDKMQPVDFRFIVDAFWVMHGLSEKEQIQVFKRIEAKVPQEKLKKLELLKAKLRELKAEKRKMNAKQKEERKWLSRLKNSIESKLEKKKKELEARYSRTERFGEDDLRRTMEKEREQLYAEYEKEINEFNMKLDIMTKKINEKSEEIKTLEKQIKYLNAQCHCAIKDGIEKAKKYRRDVESLALVLEPLENIDKLEKKLSDILEEVQYTNKRIKWLFEKDYILDLLEKRLKKVIAMFKNVSKIVNETEIEVEGLWLKDSTGKIQYIGDN